MSSARQTLAAAGSDTAPARPRGCTNFKLRQFVRRVTRHYDHAMAGTGLKVTQYSLLSHVMLAGPVQPALLAQAMTLSASTLSRNLQPLITAGWIEVLPGADGRSRQLAITATGRGKRQEAQRRWRQAQEALNRRLGVATVAALHALIDDAMTRLADDEAIEDEGADT
jgi:DNA-binding MarR family transcriptional regulator